MNALATQVVTTYKCGNCGAEIPPRSSCDACVDTIPTLTPKVTHFRASTENLYSFGFCGRTGPQTTDWAAVDCDRCLMLRRDS